MGGSYMKSNKKIIFITPGFASDELDTTCIPALQIFFLALMREIPPENIHIISLHYPYRNEIYSWNGLSIYACGGKNRGGIFKLRTWLRARAYFKNIVKNEEIDLVHSFWFSEGCFLAQSFCKRLKIPHVCSVLGQDASERNFYTKRINGSGVFLVAPSKYLGDVFKNNHSISIKYIIPLGVDIDLIKRQPKHNREIDILGVGSLIPLKNFDIFIDAIELLVVQNPGLKVVIIGEGEARAALEERILAKGLIATISLMGLIPYSKVLEYMGRSRILMHPSLHEGFGLVYAEALSSGMSIVSRETGCYQDIPNWKLADNANEFARQASELLEHFPEQHPSVDFDIRRTVSSYLELYDRLSKS